MAKTLDVYRDWLGIAETNRPLSHYQLLRLKSFEDNVALVREHYRKMNAHVRKYATGDFSAQSQSLLNELAKAMLCLTDSQRKREYDATLGRKEAGEGRRRTFEEILLGGKTISSEQLTRARNYATAVNIELRDAVLQQKLAPADVIMLAYAESLGLPFVDLADVGIDASLVARVPGSICRPRSCVPVMSDGSQLLMASPNPLIPDVEEELRLRLGMPVRTLLCTVAQVNEAIAKYYPRDSAGAPAAPAAAVKRKPAAGPKPRPEPEEQEQGDAPAKPAAPRDEVFSRHVMFGVMGGCLSVTLAMLAQLLTSNAAITFSSLLPKGVIALGLGAVIGPTVFYVSEKMRL